MERAPCLKEEDDVLVILDNLNGKWRIHQTRQTHRQTSSGVVEFSRVELLKLCGPFRREWKRPRTLLIPGIRFHIRNKGMFPNAVEIRFSIGKARNVGLRQ